ncbi:MAG TPA: oligopeptide ABC transporter permease [Streptosporangiaceae bacterium]|jgi:peptide/nickel transport system permease protein|nr:oligopeptide ABC transporter permease [Streptosporangiaceae bacterium]
MSTSPLLPENIAATDAAATVSAAEGRSAWQESPFRISMARFLRHRLAVAGLLILVALVVIAIFAPLISPYNPNATNLFLYQHPPSAAHLLGTDQEGRDVLSRLIYGARVSLTVGIAAAVSAGIVGLVLGLLAGFLGGWVDSIVMRLTEMVLSFPALVVIILIVAIIGPSLTTIIIVIALTQWPTGCRIVRQSTRSLKEMDFILTARAIGCSDFRIMLRHTLPSVLPPLTVALTVLSAEAILLEAALSFLGLGVNVPESSWGGMMQAAQSLTTLSSQPWLWLPPGIAIAVAVLAINFVGDGLRDAIDTRQQT